MYGDVYYNSGPHDYDSVVLVTAVPEPGYFPVWGGISYQNLESYRLYNQSLANVSMLNPHNALVYVHFSPEPPLGQMRTGTVQVIGGTAQVFTSGGYCLNYAQAPTNCNATGPYLSNTAETRDYFSAECIPDPEFFVSYWHYDINELSMYFGKQELSSVYLPDHTDFTVHLVPGISLSLHVEGQGVITSDNFQKLYNPKSYNEPYTEPISDLNETPESNRVEMQHHACPGYAFSHWEIKDAQGNWAEAKDTQGNLITGDLTVWMNWFQPGSLFHVPDGQLQYDVKAVFEETCVVKLKLCVEIENGVPNGDCFLFPPWEYHGHAWIEIAYIDWRVLECVSLYSSYGFYYDGIKHPDSLYADIEEYGKSNTTASRYYEITLPRARRLKEYVDSYEGEDAPPYITGLHNCASFAAMAVLRATDEWNNPFTDYAPPPWLFPLPSTLCASVRGHEYWRPTSEENPLSFCLDENEQKSFAANELQLENYLTPSVLTSFPSTTSCYLIQEAVMGNDTAFINEFLTVGGNIDTTDSYGKTFLHYAIETGQIDTVDFLLTKGANAYGFYYDFATGVGYEGTPLFAATQLQTECEFAPAACTAIANALGAAAAEVDADSTSIENNMANNNISGIINVLSSSKAIHRKTMEQLSWYALDNNNLSLFMAAIQHPSFSLASTAEDFFNELIRNKTQYQNWINLMRNYSNRSFNVSLKYSCTDWEFVEDDFLNSLLVLAFAQGNLDLVNFLLPLGADPTVQVTQEETLLEFIGEDWSQLGFAFPMVLPDWPTDKDTEILQALQAYVSSP